MKHRRKPPTDVRDVIAALEHEVEMLRNEAAIEGLKALGRDNKIRATVAAMQVKSDRHVLTIRALQKAHDRTKRYNKKMRLERDRCKAAMLERGCSEQEYLNIIQGYDWVDVDVQLTTGDITCKHCGWIIEQTGVKYKHASDCPVLMDETQASLPPVVDTVFPSALITKAMNERARSL